ncbi:MAG: TOBE-like domain-containing protein [Synechocystis sp.]
MTNANLLTFLLAKVLHLTSVFVTHDQEEAMEVADEIVVMSNGKIEQVGTAQEIYDHPATPFVMGFIGEVNVLSHTFPVLGQAAPAITHSNGHGSTPPVFVRPHDFDIQLTEDNETSQALVKRITHLGREIQMELIIGNNDSVSVQLSREQYEQFKPQTGQTLFIKPRRAKVFASEHSDVDPQLLNGAGI